MLGKILNHLLNGVPEEQGRAKRLTRKMRLLSTMSDVFVLPFLGEVTAVGLTATAAIIDTGDKAISGDFNGAVEEAAVGAVETIVTAIPFAEYAMVGIYGLSNGKINLREHLRHAVSRSFCKDRGWNSSIFEDVNSEPEISSEGQKATPPKTDQHGRHFT